MAAPVVLAAFLASLVEFVEALTIVLAVGTVRSWRSALIGTAAAVVVLIVLVGLFGGLLDHIPLHALQLVTGFLVLLFGMRWLRKAIRRAVGIIPLHDEEKAFAAETRALTAAGHGGRAALDSIAVATSFKAVLIEGIEVAFIVVALGGTGDMLTPAMLGAAAAAFLVILLGLAFHRPLSRVPENTLKFAVGILLSSFGIFWLGEGLGLPWPGEDIAMIGLAALLLATSLGLVGAARSLRSRASGESIQ